MYLVGIQKSKMVALLDAQLFLCYQLERQGLKPNSLVAYAIKFVQLLKAFRYFMTKKAEIPQMASILLSISAEAIDNSFTLVR